MKRFAPAAQRNSEPIARVLRDVLPARGTVLETASGSGQHLAYFARALPQLTWQGSEVQPEALASIQAWCDEAGVDNAIAPVVLDVTAERWPVARVDALININMVHISPWEACVGLMRGAARVVARGGVLYMYGPYRVRGQATAPSNEAFDASLRATDPQWGLRHVHRVVAEAEASGFELVDTRAMPANNLSLIFRRAPGEVEDRVV